MAKRQAGDTARCPSPLKWHGGKYYLARWINAMMPPHIHYVEPFAGGLEVLLAKSPEGVSEVVNDINLELTAFWRVLQSPDDFKEFKRLIGVTPFSQYEWKCPDPPEEYPARVRTAYRIFVKCRQSMSGRMDAFTPRTRTRTRRNMNAEVSAWLSAIEGLPEVHARLQRVLILNQDALLTLRQEDTKDTLFYCDPPYLHETRSKGSLDVYGPHEMTPEQHLALLKLLKTLRGKVIISGYHSHMYESLLRPEHGWHVRNLIVPNSSAKSTVKDRKVEMVWCNFEPPPLELLEEEGGTE